ncbi:MULTISPECIES: M48 family metallopeptidase [Halorussus]|uniref:M48 family metallopeptidase n=1 Tax=Halorussus TaxID=1070314 RepID=UPI000E20F811|nr:MULTISPECIES: M48 family metalloprotease [Halorussus]NHN58422.1 M48 family metalloprotease [Halorussus sp. JP-T4]
MTPSLAVRIWALTAALLLAAAVAVGTLVRTGAPPLYVGAGVLFLAYVSLQAYYSGGRFDVEAELLATDAPRLADAPEIQSALFAVCERAGRSVPETVLVRMDVPGAKVGYDDGAPLLAVDDRLPAVIGPAGLRAILAHELGHLGRDLHTDAIRLYLPQVVGFAAYWSAFLAGRGPTVASAGSAAFLALAYVSDRRAAAVRYALGLGAEVLALAASRYANRLEEYRADAYAAQVVSPADLTEALYRIAAVATGDNDEDVAGPVPWDADRSLLFAVFATHPSIESRAGALGCELPAWVRPYRPHLRE